MRQRLFQLLVILLCISAGWFFGYIRVPYFEYNQGFSLGIAATVVFVALLGVLLWLWNQTFIEKLKQSLKVNTLLLIGLGVTLISLSLAFNQYSANNKLKAKIRKTEAEVFDANLTIEKQTQQNNQVFLKQVLEDIDRDLEVDRSYKITPTTLEKLVKLSGIYRPYKVVIGSRTKVLSSPELGALLLHLVSANLDSVSFNLIKKKVSFANAYLPKADLRGIDLSSINLNNAYLENADLRNSNLTDASFEMVVLSNAMLDSVIGTRCNLERADLSWTQLKHSNFTEANFRGACLVSSTADKATFRNADLYLANLKNACFTETDFSDARLIGCNLERANLIYSNLLSTNLSGSNMNLTNLSEVKVTSDWFKVFKEPVVTRGIDVVPRYRLEADSAAGDSIYRLKPLF